MHPIDPTAFEDSTPSGDREARRPTRHARPPDEAAEGTVAQPVVPGSPGDSGAVDRFRVDRPTSIAPREELRRVDALNEALGSVVRELAGVTTVEGIDDALRSLSSCPLYEGATYLGGIGPRGGSGDEQGDLPAAADRTALAWRDRTATPPPLESRADLPALERGSWAVVPVRCGETVLGRLALATDRRWAFGERELGILERFGETLGATVDAAADRRLLRSDAVTELTLTRDGGPLAAVAGAADCRLTLTGVVPGEDLLAFFRVEDGDAHRVAEISVDVDGVGATRSVDDATVEIALPEETTLCALARPGTTVRSAEADDEGLRAVVDVTGDSPVRELVEDVRERVPGVRLASKRTRERPPTTARTPGDASEGSDLTDRQREVVEAAYRAGYFEWPRDRTAEEVAASLGISSPTFHKHLRAAEQSLVSSLVGTDDPRMP